MYLQTLSYKRSAGRAHYKTSKDIRSCAVFKASKCRYTSRENIQPLASPVEDTVEEDAVAVGISVLNTSFGISTFANPGTGMALARARLYQLCVPSHCRPVRARPTGRLCSALRCGSRCPSSGLSASRADGQVLMALGEPITPGKSLPFVSRSPHLPHPHSSWFQSPLFKQVIWQ